MESPAIGNRFEKLPIHSAVDIGRDIGHESSAAGRPRRHSSGYAVDGCRLEAPRDGGAEQEMIDAQPQANAPSIVPASNVGSEG